MISEKIVVPNEFKLRWVAGSKTVTCSVLTDKQTKSKDRGNLFRAFGVPHFSPSSRSGPTMNHFTGSAVFQMISEIIKIYLYYLFILKEQSFISECS